MKSRGQPFPACTRRVLVSYKFMLFVTDIWKSQSDMFFSLEFSFFLSFWYTVEGNVFFTFFNGVAHV